MNAVEIQCWIPEDLQTAVMGHGSKDKPSRVKLRYSSYSLENVQYIEREWREKMWYVRIFAETGQADITAQFHRGATSGRTGEGGQMELDMPMECAHQMEQFKEQELRVLVALEPFEE